jgi:hypothetical protein
MSDAWLAFAASGDPSHSDTTPWLPHTIEKRATTIFDDPCRVVEHLFPKERRVLEAMAIPVPLPNSFWDSHQYRRHHEGRTSILPFRFV